MMTTRIYRRTAFTALAVAVAAMAAISSPAVAGFISYEIRGTPTINDLGGGQTEFIIENGGDKAGLGSNDINGFTLGDIKNLRIERLDDPSRFTAGSGPAVAPYLNFWITDGTNYAVVANEPSNPAFQPLYNNGYDLSFADLADKVAKIYEITDQSWLPNNGVNLTFADLASFVIAPPDPSYFTSPPPGLGSGAPRELGTNIAYGTNWVFGDTLSNYVSGDPGYIVQGAAVAATEVPLPATLPLFGFGLAGLLLMAKRRLT